jgi:hypothetical protein
MNWTEHPTYFRKTIDKYIQHEAIVFDGIHFLHVFLWLMTKRYDLLAKHYVNLDGRFISDSECALFLQTRTQKINMNE